VHGKDTAPIRPGEELDVARLCAYLDGKLDGASGGIRVEQFPGGHSNLTYLVEAGGVEYVLRRAPLGPVAPKAHDMAREYRILSAISPHFRPAPKPFLLCEDPEVIGAVFFIMERRRGVVLRTEILAPWAGNTGLPALISQAFLDCLVEMHSVDIVRHGLDSLGKPLGFIERQVRGWTERWYRSKTEEIPEMDRVIAFLTSNLPPDGPPTIVHNDFKLDNLMLDPANPARVEAVLDWEMATVGDPLVDLGLTLCYWDPPDREVREGPVPCLTQGPGWLTKQQLAEEYARRTGRDMSALAYHEILGIFKLAVIVQQIYYRWWKGQTKDERFARFHLRVKSLVEAAAARLEASA
jgi:aminoglycoside phosphotransferase (APT) family kinase protein